jgi:UDP-N-acetylmuramyl tripeptide synthase
VLDFAHTPDALTRTLATARRLARGSVWVVFGAGGERDQGKRPLLGAAAAAGADRIVLTSDNPRREDPAQIIAQIRAGIPHASTVYQDPSRAAAIAFAMREAAADDLVVIAGRGRETHQLVGTQWLPLADADIARQALENR